MLLKNYNKLKFAYNFKDIYLRYKGFLPMCEDMKTYRQKPFLLNYSFEDLFNKKIYL